MGFYTKNGGYLGIGQLSQPDGVFDLQTNQLIGGAATDLASLFGVSPTDSTTFVMNWDDTYTAQGANSTLNWNGMGSIGFFISGFGITTDDNLGRISGYLSNVLSNLTACDTASASGGYSTGYSPSAANNFGTTTNGIWCQYNDYNSSNPAVGTFTFNSGLGNAIGVATQSWSSTYGAYHACAAISITCNSITKYFAPKATIRASSVAGGGFVYYPTTFTSFSDYANIGSTDICPSSNFIY